MSFNSRVFLKPIVKHVISLSDLYWQTKIEESNQYWQAKFYKGLQQINLQNIENKNVKKRALAADLSKKKRKHQTFIKRNQKIKNDQLIKNINDIIKQDETDKQKIAFLKNHLEFFFVKEIKKLIGDETKKIKKNEEHDRTKKNILEFHLKRLTFLMEIALPHSETAKNKTHWLTNLKNGVGKFIKKFLSPIANTLDDIANAIQSMGGLAAKLILGGAVVVVHLFNVKEGIEGILKAVKLKKKAKKENNIFIKIKKMLEMHHEEENPALNVELQDKEIAKLDKHHLNQDKTYRTRIAANSLGVVTSLLGVGTASAYLAYSVGAAVLAGAFLPSVFFGLLTIKSGYDLWLKVVILNQANEDVKEAKTFRNNAYHAFEVQQNIVNEASSPEKIKKLERMTKLFEASERHYQACVNARFNARKEVAFHAIELILNTVVFVSTVIGAIVTLGVSSTVITAIGGTAAGIGLACKAYEWRDKHVPMTKRIIAACKNTWNNLFPAPPKKNRLSLKPEPINRKNFMSIPSLMMQKNNPGKSKLIIPSPQMKKTDPAVTVSPEPLLSSSIIETSKKFLTFNDTNKNYQKPSKRASEKFAPPAPLVKCVLNN